jgi:isoquinoline 1-oxidoreductase subunit beta
MVFDDAGTVTVMEHHAAAGWPTQITAPFFMPKGQAGVPYDPFAISGDDPPVQCRCAESSCHFQ